MRVASSGSYVRACLKASNRGAASISPRWRVRGVSASVFARSPVRHRWPRDHHTQELRSTTQGGRAAPPRQVAMPKERQRSASQGLRDADGGAQAASGEPSAAPAPAKMSNLRRISSTPGDASAASAEEEDSTHKEPKIQSSLVPTDLSNIAHGDGEQPDNIIHAIENGEIDGLDWDESQLQQQTDCFDKQLTYSLPDVDDEFWSLYDGEELEKLNERLALYRIKAHKISEGALLEDLVDAKLIEEYSSAINEDHEYLKGYERDFEWYFDTKYSRRGFHDYQRLVLRNNYEYLDWDEYRQTYSTYLGDQEFVEFYQKLSSKIKCFDHLGVTRQHEWPRYQRLALYQAVKIAAGYSNILMTLVYTGLYECLWSIRLDNSTYKEPGRLYFEIWKRATKEKMDFVTALQQIYDQGMCAPCRFDMKLELDYLPGSGGMKINYDNYVAVIGGEVQEIKAYQMIIDAVKKIVPKPKTYYDYARKKLDISRKIGMIPLQG